MIKEFYLIGIFLVLGDAKKFSAPLLKKYIWSFDQILGSELHQ